MTLIHLNFNRKNVCSIGGGEFKRQSLFTTGGKHVRIIVAVIGSLVLLAVGAFCLFGFAATFEPTDRPSMFLAFRIGYTAVSLGCVTGITVLLIWGFARN